jgi:trehalose 6-phosphate phosphatase
LFRKNTVKAVFPAPSGARHTAHNERGPFVVSRAAFEIREPGGFFREVSAAQKRVLILDYDGTIAPFCRDRRRAFPYQGVPELLCRIATACRTRVIVITGRAADEIVPLVGVFAFPEIWGTYGLERLYADNGQWCRQYEESGMTDAALDALAQAEVSLETAGLGEHIEVKLAGVAVHWRGLEPSEILQIRTKAQRILEPLTRESELVMAEFEQGFEIRLRSASKSNALRKLLSDLSSDVPVAYLGDDATDEDAFRLLNGRGLTVLVRPKRKFTSAQIWLKPPEELIGFLKDWTRACGVDQ